MRANRTWSAVAATAAVLGLVACDAVLGLDAPTLASGCTGSNCSDASTFAPDVAIPDSASPIDAPGADVDAQDAAPPPVCMDAMAPDSAAGVLCGGGCFGYTYCTGATPVCCQTTNDAGVTAYGCTASEGSCTGYPIVCADDDDCGGNDICCHFTTKTTCDSTASCPAADLVCRPSVTDDCPQGKACDVPAVDDGVTSPYLLCEP